MVKEMIARSRELVAGDESTVMPEPRLDAVVVEDRESNGCLPNSCSTDEGNWFEIFCETNGLLDQLGASETGPRSRGRRYSWRGAVKT